MRTIAVIFIVILSTALELIGKVLYAIASVSVNVAIMLLEMIPDKKRMRRL